jgi:hypothetical protein
MDSSIGPVIIVCGVRVDKVTAVYELSRRGFIVKHVSPKENDLNIVVCMSRKLTAKLATQHNLPVLAVTQYTLSQQVTMATEGTSVILRASALKVQDCWVAHDKNQHELQSALSKTTVNDPNETLQLINGYYGSQIAMYYGFLAFYTNSLVPPMVAGAALFYYQFRYDQIDSTWLPVFCLGTTIWSTFFLETWKGRCAELAYSWDVFGYEDQELTAELAKVRYNRAVGVYSDSLCVFHSSSIVPEDVVVRFALCGSVDLTRYRWFRK